MANNSPSSDGNDSTSTIRQPLAIAIQWASEALSRLSDESANHEELDCVCRVGALLEGFAHSPELAKKFAEIVDSSNWLGNESNTVVQRLDALRSAILALRQNLANKIAEPPPWEVKSAGDAIDNLRKAINGLFLFRAQLRTGHLSGVHTYFRDVALQTVMRLAVSSVLQVPGIKESEFDSFRVDVVRFTNDRRKDASEWSRLEGALHEMEDRLLAGRESARLISHSDGELKAYPFVQGLLAGTDNDELSAVVTQPDPFIELLRVFTNGVSDDRISEATDILKNDTLPANEKLVKIDALLPFPATASAEQLGKLLGVTKQAVLKTDWWIQNRKGEKENEVGRRRAGHQKRAKCYEPSPKDDDEDQG